MISMGKKPEHHEMVGDEEVKLCNAGMELSPQPQPIAAIVLIALFALLPNPSEASDATSLVAAAAKRHGVPASFALHMAKLESGVKCGVHNRRSSASGPLQVVRGTARAMGYRGDIRRASCAVQTEYGVKALAMCWRAAKGRPALAKRCHQQGISAIYRRRK